MITGAQSTRCGHRRRITRCGGRYGPRWSSAAVSEWVSGNEGKIADVGMFWVDAGMTAILMLKWHYQGACSRCAMQQLDNHIHWW